jgi:hypothetical protein
METGNIVKIFAVLFVFLMVMLMSQVTQKDIVANVIGCEDYIYRIDLNAVPTHLYIVTTETGKEEFFKTDDAYVTHFDTILHCGHNYKIVYSSEGYEDYTEEFDVSKYINPTSQYKSINLIKK